MLKILSDKTSSGYTIVEIIVSIGIVVGILSLTMANYREFTLNKSLDAVKSGIVSDLKLAQEYSISGKIPDGCINLNGFVFSSNFNSNPDLNYYRIIADCDTDVILKTVLLSKYAKNVRYLSAPEAILFKILGQGTNITPGGTVIITIQQLTTLDTRTIVVSSGGEIR